MMFNLIVFLLLILLLCGSIWAWIRKNVRPTSEPHPPRSHFGSKDLPLRIDPAPAQSQPKPLSPTGKADIPAASPDNTEVPQWTNRRLLPDRRLFSERWRDWLALTTTLMALLAILSSLEATRSSMMAMILTGKEGSQWLMFQAKGIKEYSYQIAKLNWELQLAGNSEMTDEAADKYRQAIKKYDEELKRYKDEKDELMQEGLALAKAKEKNQKRAAGLNAALVFLLIAVLLSSIATLIRKKYIWYAGLVMMLGWIYFLIVNF